MPDTGTKVIDASALAAVIFGEPSAETVADRVRGFHLVAPALLDFEIASTCMSKIRRQPVRRDELLAAYEARDKTSIETMAVDQSSVLALAERPGLTCYDASYLHLARALGVELVTLDRQLQAAAERFK